MFMLLLGIEADHAGERSIEAPSQFQQNEATKSKATVESETILYQARLGINYPMMLSSTNGLCDRMLALAPISSA